MKRWRLYTLIALVGACLLAYTASQRPFAEQLIHVSLKDALPTAMAEDLQAESLILQQTFLAWSSDEALTLAARRAMLTHPAIARQVFEGHGMDPAFQQVLRRYGADVILPVHYFETNELPLINVRLWSADKARDVTESLSQWWSDAPNSTPGSSPQAEAPGSPGSAMAPTRRAQLAMRFLEREGYRFMDQFVVDDAGAVHWLKGERALSAVSDFFTSGLRDLERKTTSDQPIGGWDVASAGLDVLVAASAVKALRAGAALRSTRAGQVTRSGVKAERRALLPAATRAVAGSATARLAIYATTGWLVVTHPSLISGLGATLAGLIGAPVWLVQALLWFVVLLPALWLLSLGFNVGYRLMRPFRALARILTRTRSCRRSQSQSG
jgi:hypothetical protein